jgi:MarR family transcriptional regulator, organic hydroperoxide resistance regulator
MVRHAAGSPVRRRQGSSLLTIAVGNEYIRVVAGKLQQEIRQTKAIRLLEEEATLNIVRTADVLMLGLADVLKPYALSPTQYNVLRILRGAGKPGASCKDVGSRLITRDPDITRLMDRLEKRGVVARDRAKEDRRVVTHRLTEAGLELVNELDRPIEELHRRVMRHLKADRLRELIGLLEEVRGG